MKHRSRPQPLRIGVHCAVIDGNNNVGLRILLSRRGDLNVWSIPGGRLDSGETLQDCAVREVREETGIRAVTLYPVNLYYMQGWRRMNILYAMRPIGGALRSKTTEAHDNRYFPVDELPEGTFFADRLHDIWETERPYPRIIETPNHELRRLRRKFAMRWIYNLVSGRPEPRYPVFRVYASAVIRSEQGARVLALPAARKFKYALPRLPCHGEAPIWEQLAEMVYSACGTLPRLQWVGLWQAAHADAIEFIFTASAPESETIRAGMWVAPRFGGFGDRDHRFVEKVIAHGVDHPVWTIFHDDSVRDGTVIPAAKKQILSHRSRK